MSENSIKIVAFSDLHGEINPQLTDFFTKNPADILVFAGDIQYNPYDYGDKTVDWIDSLPYTYKLCTFGNHDGNYKRFIKKVAKKKNFYFLVNEAITIMGINFFFSPDSPIFGSWHFMHSEKELEKIYAKIPENTDFLVTHTPPFGILDQNRPGVHLGSKALRARIPFLNIKYHVFGHIHEAYGRKEIRYINSQPNILFLNSSVLDIVYKFTNFPHIIEIKE